MKKAVLINIILLVVLLECKNNLNIMEDAREKTYKSIRPPEFSGQFYPADKFQLEKDMAKYLASVPEKNLSGPIKAIIAPHAGYVYSGPVAAQAYSLLQGKSIGTAVIISNSHANYFSGIAVDKSDAWETPLGLVEVDRELADKLAGFDPVIEYNSAVHKSDHTLEVQLPFLQNVISGDFKIVPLLFGNTNGDTYKKLARALASNLGDNDIVVISTDLSHYPGYEDATTIDKQTLDLIGTRSMEDLDSYIAETKKVNIANEETLCCGIDGVKTAMALADISGWQAEVLYYANSGDVAIGNKSRVVGYGAVAFFAPEEISPKSAAYSREILTPARQTELLNLARATVESFVRYGQVPVYKNTDARLEKNEGAFVTLHQAGELCGCIGQIVPGEQPLWQVVQEMAVAAATKDHRFKPVSEKD